MSASQSQSPLDAYGLKLGPKCTRPENFEPALAWSTFRYSFHIDLVQMVGRRITTDANPDLYFRLVPSAPARKKASFNVPRIPVRTAKFGLSMIAVAAAFIVIYPFYPAAKYQVDKKVAETISHTSVLAAAPALVSSANRVIIPKIGVDTAILEGKSLAVLNKADGVWHETGVETSNIVLAGHRFKYLPPNTTTLYNLDKVTAGDTIIVDWYHKRYIYVVTATETVTKTDIGIRNPSATPTLTIYSCEEKSQAHRIVVHAKLIN